jgi:hypothetical protein
MLKLEQNVVNMMLLQLDSKKLGVYFSPQTMIDEDIIAQLGFIDLDNYIGDPGDIDSDSYPRFIQVCRIILEKYQ